MSGRGCFAAGSLVMLADGSTTPIEDIQEGADVLGWQSAADATAGRLAPTPLKVSKLQMHVENKPSLKGLRLVAENKSAYTVPPFVTTNHPLLSADGDIVAIDAELGNSELSLLAHDKEAKSQIVKPVVTGRTRLLLASSAKKNAPILPVTVEEVMAVSDSPRAVHEEMDEKRGSMLVYHLEFNIAGRPVYIVNDILVMMKG